MQRVDAPEILDSDECSPDEAKATLAVLGRVNRWFGGVAATQRMIERVAQVTGRTRFSMLEVAAGSGELPQIVRRNLARRGIELDIVLLDLLPSHLPAIAANGFADFQPNHLAVAANALAMPFSDHAFDLVSCNLFAHHLCPATLQQFLREAARVSRRAVLINDLIRHPLHLALAFAGYPMMWDRVAWLDGLTSVRRAYVPEELLKMIAEALGTVPQVEISQHYLYRMGVIVFK